MRPRVIKQFTVRADVLSNAFDLVAQPRQAYVRLDLEGSVLTAHTRSDDVVVAVDVEAIGTPGAVVLPLASMKSVLKGLDTQPVQFNQTRDMVQWQAGGQKGMVIAVPKETMPKSDISFSHPNMMVGADVLKKALTRLLKISKGGSVGPMGPHNQLLKYPVLESVYIDATGPTLVACDPTRLAYWELGLDAQFTGESVVATEPLMRVLLSRLRSGGDVQLAWHEEKFAALCDGVRIAGRSLPWPYPIWRNFCPTTFDNKFVFGSKVLVDAVKRLATTTDREGRLYLKIASDFLRLGTHPDIAEDISCASREGTYVGWGWFRLRKFLEGLQMLEGKKMILEFNTPSDVGINVPLHLSGEGRLHYYMMPLIPHLTVPSLDTPNQQGNL